MDVTSFLEDTNVGDGSDLDLTVMDFMGFHIQL